MVVNEQNGIALSNGTNGLVHKSDTSAPNNDMTFKSTAPAVKPNGSTTKEGQLSVANGDTVPLASGTKSKEHKKKSKDHDKEHKSKKHKRQSDEKKHKSHKSHKHSKRDSNEKVKTDTERRSSPSKTGSAVFKAGPKLESPKLVNESSQQTGASGELSNHKVSDDSFPKAPVLSSSPTKDCEPPKTPPSLHKDENSQDMYQPAKSGTEAIGKQHAAKDDWSPPPMYESKDEETRGSHCEDPKVEPLKITISATSIKKQCEEGTFFQFLLTHLNNSCNSFSI